MGNKVLANPCTNVKKNFEPISVINAINEIRRVFQAWLTSPINFFFMKVSTTVAGHENLPVVAEDIFLNFFRSKLHPSQGGVPPQLRASLKPDNIPNFSPSFSVWPDNSVNISYPLILQSDIHYSILSVVDGERPFSP